ncbi:MAG: hypothetical protein ACP5KS_11065, partial [Candidatus Hydrogenedens sp.]
SYFVVSGISCKTSADKKKGEETVSAGELIPFVPDNPVSNIQCMRGPYPKIFNPESQAVWMSPNSSTTHGVTIEIVLDSSFQDMSIAYDSVSLRGFNIYMLLNENTEIHPTQIVVDKSLEEIPSGTLRRFKRKVTLIFPYNANEILVPKEGLQNVKIYLILNGYDTLFCFSWSPKQVPVEVPLTMKLKDSKENLKKKQKSLHKKVLNWTHTFD